MAADATKRLYRLESGATLPVMAYDPWRGKWALVTGASSGIGMAVAEELAAGGAHLVLTARRARRLAKLRRNLHAAHGVRIEVLPADLAQPNTPAEIFALTKEQGIAVDVLVNNAGIGSYGAFRASDRERELGIIQVNCSALVHLRASHCQYHDVLDANSISGSFSKRSAPARRNACGALSVNPQSGMWL